MLERSGDDPDLGNAISNITDVYLEGSWLLVSSGRIPVAQLLVFDTRLPQQDLRSWRILELPPHPHIRRYLTFARYKNSSAECPEFLVDPAQRIFGLSTGKGLVFVVLVELLIRYTHSVRTSSCIPWDEWGRDVIIINLRFYTPSLQIFDTKVLALHHPVASLELWGVDVYDLSRSGRRDIRVQRIGEGAGGSCKKVLPTPRWFIPCPEGDGFRKSMSLLGNVVYFLVSPLYVQKWSPYSILRRTGYIALYRREFATHLEIGPNINPGERLKIRLDMRDPQINMLHPFVPIISDKPVVRRIGMSRLQTPRL